MLWCMSICGVSTQMYCGQLGGRVAVFDIRQTSGAVNTFVSCCETHPYMPQSAGRDACCDVRLFVRVHVWSIPRQQLQGCMQPVHAIRHTVQGGRGALVCGTVGGVWQQILATNNNPCQPPTTTKLVRALHCCMVLLLHVRSFVALSLWVAV